MLYTFQQPVRGGYYYLVVKAKDEEDALDKAHTYASTLEHTTDTLVPLSHFPEDTLVLDPKMKQGLNELGWADRFIPT